MSIDQRAPRDENEVIAEINTTPLVDVMLALLIMLIVTIPAQTHAVRMELPLEMPSSVEPAIVNLAIDPGGAISWNGTLVLNRAALEARLRAAASAVPQPELHIAPDARAPYAAVAEVLAEAQRLGMTTLGLVGDQRFIGRRR